MAVETSPGSVVLRLNELEEAGYIDRRRDPADRRRHVVDITPARRKMLEHGKRAQEGLEDEVLGALSAEERDTLRSLLSRALEPSAG